MLRFSRILISLILALGLGVSNLSGAIAASTDATATFTVNGVAQVDGDTINVAHGTTTVTVIATPTDGNAIAVITGDTGLATGTNTVTVVVTAEDGTTSITTTFTVVVAAAVADTEITSFDAIADVAAGTAGAATYANAAAVIAALPNTASANTNAVSVPVTTWVDTDTYNPAVAGSYTFTATLGTLPAGWANTGAFTATVEIVVAAAVVTPPSTPSTGGGLSFADEEKVRLANEKAAADKVAAEKAAADAAAAEKLAAEKLAAERAEADKKIAAEEALKAAEEIKAAEAAEALVAAAKIKAAKTSGKLKQSSKSTRLTLDLADKYSGQIAFIELLTKTKKGTKVTTLDYFVLENEDGTATVVLKKLVKGQRIQVRIDNAVVFRATA